MLLVSTSSNTETIKHHFRYVSSKATESVSRRQLGLKGRIEDLTTSVLGGKTFQAEREREKVKLSFLLTGQLTSHWNSQHLCCPRSQLQSSSDCKAWGGCLARVQRCNRCTRRQ